MADHTEEFTGKLMPDGITDQMRDSFKAMPPNVLFDVKYRVANHLLLPEGSVTRFAPVGCRWAIALTSPTSRA